MKKDESAETPKETVREALDRINRELYEYHKNHPDTNNIKRHAWTIEGSTTTFELQCALNDELRALIKRAAENLKRIEPNRKHSINFIKENYKDSKSLMIKVDEKVEETYLIIGIRG